jgi:hypothetical protein
MKSADPGSEFGHRYSQFSRATSELSLVLLEAVHESAVQVLTDGSFCAIEQHSKARRCSMRCAVRTT